MSSIKDGLSKYLPENTIDLVCSYLPKKNLEISVVNDRVTKLGDFRPMSKICKYHRISVNGGLNPYSFLITFLHEIAHLYVFEKYGSRAKSHGCEWQLEYTGLMFPILEQHLLPDELHNAMFQHFPFPTASSNADQNLVMALRKFDKNPEILTLNDISINETFIFQKNIYQKIKKLRSFYYCIRVVDKKPFRIHSLAEVQRFDGQEMMEKL